ncbi:uncharacterized protein LOC130676347 [Microplitis mediator]|uniref:uncharacterized protein LOC130676347 n=1 Tax=Microplitis mediator TaxID=375433 RepID=UPI002553B461|nr:uncharacterized protein LOC130676347 [Microplitis mediator]
MFRQINVHPDDWDYQRILWVDDDNQPPSYHLTTVTYGTRPAPYLAGRVLKQLIIDEGDKYPLAVEPFEKGSYVDDICGGADNVNHLNNIASQVEAICLAGCFPLAKWKSNHPQFSKLSSSNISNSHEFNESTSEILGLSWKCQSDHLTFTGHTSQKAAITKRSILSETAQLFDSLGLISPVVIKAKILMQDLWLEKIGWDDSLSPQIIHRWKKFRDELPELLQLKIPRWLNISSDISNIEIHGFSDASQHAIAAAVYIKTHHHLTPAKITLVCAKTRVAPLKRLTIPRLELSAALLLTELISHVQTTLNLQDVPVYLWTDSAVALAWIKQEPSKWKEFVKNRVQSIQQNLPAANWKFISGKQNPADCASRGLTPSYQLWWSGPTWLLEPSHQWPEFTSQEDPEVDTERKSAQSHLAITSPSLPLGDLLESSSNLTRLLRITAIIKRAVAVFRKIPASSLHVSPLTPAGIHSALYFWIKNTQQEYFKNEISQLSQNKSFLKSHPFSRLTAYIDSTDIVRVCGRLQNSHVDTDSKHPPILPKKCHLSHLIISNAHARTMHGGTQLMLAAVRKKCWIFRERIPFKSYIQRCVVCVRQRAQRSQQLMGQLPTSRVSPSLVFESTGVDYAEPVQLKYFQGRGTRCYKGWIAVFVMLLNFCNSLGSWADVILKQLLTGALNESSHLQQILTSDGTQWIFNPPSAPHMGGKGEAAVKSVKHHLQRTIADLLLTYEDFSTFLTHVEILLNSRPLSALTDDPEDIAALTPGHFIRGAPLNTVPEPSVTSVPTSRLSLYQRIQERLQYFWERWSVECLQSHQSISKWHTSHHDIKIGSLVLIVDERYPPSKWPLARVTHLHPGSDGLTRVVTVKTATSTFTRPVTKLVLLPISTAKEDSHLLPSHQYLLQRVGEGGENVRISRACVSRRYSKAG